MSINSNQLRTEFVQDGKISSIDIKKIYDNNPSHHHDAYHDAEYLRTQIFGDQQTSPNSSIAAKSNELVGAQLLIAAEQPKGETQSLNVIKAALYGETLAELEKENSTYHHIVEGTSKSPVEITLQDTRNDRAAQVQKSQAITEGLPVSSPANATSAPSTPANNSQSNSAQRG